MAGLQQQQKGPSGMRQGIEENSKFPVRQGLEGPDFVPDGSGKRLQVHPGEPQQRAAHR